MVRLHRVGNTGAYARGAVVWKVLLAIGVGGGGVWAASRLATNTSSLDDWRSATTQGETRLAAPAADPGTTTTTNTPNAPTTDPFAGVDVRSDSVLRHIAGIEDKARTRQGATPKRPAAPGPETAARAPEAAPAPAPAREDVAPETRARPVAQPTAPATIAATAPVDALRAGAAPSQAPEPAQPRTAVDSAAANTPDRPAKGVVALPPPTVPSATAERTLAAARPEPAAPPPAVAAPLRIANRTMPEFPGEAIRAGVRSGRVVARLSIDADGRVTATQLLSASPTGFFERESRRALSTWRYEPPGQPTTTDVELVFTRE